MASIVLENPVYRDVYRDLILQSRDMLLDGLKRLEAQGLLSVAESRTNFAFIRLQDARGIFDALADRGIMVRRFGEEHLRITAGTQAENREVLAALEFLIKHPDARM